MRLKDNTHGVQDRGRESTNKETELSKAQGKNDAAGSAAGTPSFDDAEFLIRAGYELVPPRDGGKEPRDRDWPNRRYNPPAVIAEARAPAATRAAAARGATWSWTWTCATAATPRSARWSPKLAWTWIVAYT